MSSKSVVLVRLTSSSGGGFLCNVATKWYFSQAFMFSTLHLLFSLHDFLTHLNSGAQDDLLENACYLQIMNVPWKFQHLSRELGILKKKIEAKLIIPFEK